MENTNCDTTDMNICHSDELIDLCHDFPSSDYYIDELNEFQLNELQKFPIVVGIDPNMGNLVHACANSGDFEWLQESCNPPKLKKFDKTHQVLFLLSYGHSLATHTRNHETSQKRRSRRRKGRRRKRRAIKVEIESENMKK